MLETGVFALGVLTNDAEINVLVSCLVSGDILDKDDRSVDVEFLSKGASAGA